MASLPIPNGSPNRNRHERSNNASDAALRQSSSAQKSERSRYLWIVVALLYSLVLPREFRFQVGDLTFFMDRVVLFAALPFVLFEVMRSRVQFILVDAFVLIIGVLMVISIIVNYDFAAGLERGGAYALDTVMPYFIARIFIRSLDTLRRALILFAPGLIIAAGFVTVESFTSTPIARPAAALIFGPLQNYSGGEAAGVFVFQPEYRLGLMRASGPFQHPILGGLFLTSVLPLYWLGGLRGWPKLAGTAAAFASFFSLSSAAFLGLFFGIGLLVFKMLQDAVDFLSWRMLIGIIAVTSLLIELLSAGGLLKFIIRNLTLNAQTGYFRLLIWEFGGENVARNPLFGIGFRAYERPSWIYTDSVDTHWLLLALRFGLPTALGLGMVAILAIASSGIRGSAMKPFDRDLRWAIAMSISLVGLMGFTVALFGAMNTWFMFLIGLGFCGQSNTVTAQSGN